jgi:hypothetical protein
VQLTPTADAVYLVSHGFSIEECSRNLFIRKRLMSILLKKRKENRKK